MTRTIRVASVPADHPYVAHLQPPDGRSAVVDGEPVEVVRLPDPPVVGDDGRVRWWPPRVLDPEWVHRHASEFDVLHVHFGFESFTPEHLRRVVAAAHDEGKAVVVTVHDLRNPHVADEAAQLERLDALVPDADAVVTLTGGAAAVIEERWGRRALVVPHPHVVPLGRPSARREGRAATRSRVGLHLKSLRTNVDAVGALRGIELAARSADLDAIVTIHREILDPSDRRHDPALFALAQELERAGVIEVVAHEPMDDEELFTHVESLDVSVIANVWGTHSGWIEMCHDLGVRVVAPRIGFYAEQHSPILYDLAGGSSARIDPQRLALAIVAACRLGSAAPATTGERKTEREHIAREHVRIYRDVLATAAGLE